VFVRTLYNGEIMKIPGCNSNHDGSCEAFQFLRGMAWRLLVGRGVDPYVFDKCDRDLDSRELPMIV